MPQVINRGDPFPLSIAPPCEDRSRRSPALSAAAQYQSAVITTNPHRLLTSLLGYQAILVQTLHLNLVLDVTAALEGSERDAVTALRPGIRRPTEEAILDLPHFLSSPLKILLKLLR